MFITTFLLPWHICLTLAYQQSHKICFIVQIFISMFPFENAVILVKYSKSSWCRKLQARLCASFDDLPLPGFDGYLSILTLSLCSMQLLIKSGGLFVFLHQLTMSCGSMAAKKKQSPQTVMSHTLWPLKGHRWVISSWRLSSELPVVVVAIAW